MKRTHLLICLLLSIFSGKSQSADSNSFILRGKVIGKDTGYVYLWYRGLDGGISDSVRLSRGEFMFRGKVWEPTGAIFSSFCFASNDRTKYDSKNLTELFIEPGSMCLAAKADSFESAELGGSRSDSDRVKLLRLKDPVEIKIRPVLKEAHILAPVYNSEFSKDRNADAFRTLKIKMDSLQSVLNSLDTEVSQIDSAFIADNPNSYYAASLLLKYVSGGSTDLFPDIGKLYNRFPSNIQESSYGKGIGYVMEFERTVRIGAGAIDFMALNIRGDTIRLSDYKDRKYVLLDFWASWCVPCRHITPALYKINVKYRDKLEIISIANHDKESDWLAAIKKDQMDWTQILDHDGSNKLVPDSGTITDLYYINEIPTLILLDRSNRIVKIFGTGGKNRLPVVSLETELEKILH